MLNFLKLFLPITVLVAGGSFYWWTFGGPHQFVDRPIEVKSLDHLRSGSAALAAWTKSPDDVADEYLYWQCHPSDRPRRSKLDIAVSCPTADKAVVTLLQSADGDSATLSCDKITLARQGKSWVPVRHQAAWQGRGRMGWTTLPTL